MAHPDTQPRLPTKEEENVGKCFKGVKAFFARIYYCSPCCRADEGSGQDDLERQLGSPPVPVPVPVDVGYAEGERMVYPGSRQAEKANPGGQVSELKDAANAEKGTEEEDVDASQEPADDDDNNILRAETILEHIKNLQILSSIEIATEEKPEPDSNAQGQDAQSGDNEQEVIVRKEGTPSPPPSVSILRVSSPPSDRDSPRRILFPGHGQPTSPPTIDTNDEAISVHIPPPAAVPWYERFAFSPPSWTASPSPWPTPDSMFSPSLWRWSPSDPSEPIRRIRGQARKTLALTPAPQKPESEQHDCQEQPAEGEFNTLGTPGLTPPPWAKSRRRSGDPPRPRRSRVVRVDDKTPTGRRRSVGRGGMSAMGKTDERAPRRRFLEFGGQEEGSGQGLEGLWTPDRREEEEPGPKKRRLDFRMEPDEGSGRRFEESPPPQRKEDKKPRKRLLRF